MGVANSSSTSWSGSLLWGEKTSERCSANKSAFSLSLFVHGAGGVEYLRIGGDVDAGFLLLFIGFQIELSSLFRSETYCLKDSFLISWSLDFSLLLCWLNILLLSGV
jgi:hypothetical protein